MRQLTLIATGLVILCLGANDAVIQCSAAATSFTIVPGVSEQDVFDAANLAGLLGTGFACQQQDKIFSNFTVESGALPPDTSLNLILQILGGGLDAHTVNFHSGNFISDFRISYDISVDPLSSERIIRVSGDVLNSAGLSVPSNLKTVAGVGGFTGSLTSTPGSPGTPITVPALDALHVADQFTADLGGATDIDNSFVQTATATPEPGTTALIGAGLLALGFISRRRIVKF